MESGIQLKESVIPLTFGILNPERLRVRDLTSSFFASSQNIDSPERFILPFSLEKLALLSLVKVTPSSDRKMIKLLTFDNLFASL